MSVCVSIDGVMVGPEAATVSVFDRGFLYGDSVFETVRTYDGQPYALGPHLERLARSAQRVFIPLPVTLEVLQAEILRTVVQAANDESYIRIMVTRGAGQLGLPSEFAEGPTRVVIVTPLSAPATEAYERGIRVISHRTRRATDATAAEGAKVANYLVAIMAMREAKSRGAAEALVVDGEGLVMEGATSNVFLVPEGGPVRLVTPPESAGILPGITRAGVLEVAKRLGLPVELRAPALSELSRAREVFISSSIREVLSVVAVDDQPIGGGAPGPVYGKLLRGFRELVQGRMSGDEPE